MRIRSLLRHRPSPAIAISSVALFMSLGGVGYAATQLPSNSVGASQLRNNSVSYKKIQPGAVGNVRANTKQLQERVFKTCSGSTAITAIAQNGDPTCSGTLPAEVGTTNNTANNVGSTAVTVTSVALPAGNTYLAVANPQVTVTPATGVTAGTAQHTTVTCILTVGSNTETRSVTVDTTAPTAETASIPLQATGGSGTGSVSCTSATAAPAAGGGGAAPAAPAVSVTSAFNAIQTANS